MMKSGIVLSLIGLLVFLVLESKPSLGYWQLSEGNGTFVSPRDIFELGLFRGVDSSGTAGWYLGIWYKRFPFDPPVWVANRDDPTGVLKINNSNLFLLDQSGGVVWETNLTRTGAAPLVLELLDSGNFVLRQSDKNGSKSDGVLWQSFNHPTDTILPGMKPSWKVGTEERYLRSWYDYKNPSSGSFVYVIDGETGGFILDDGTPIYRLGPSDTIYRIADSALRTSTTTNYYSKLKLTSTGDLILSEWTPPARDGKVLWSFPSDICDDFITCGANSFCDMNPLKSCSCLQGFKPASGNEQDVPNGSCVRNSSLTCADDVFERFTNMKLPLIDEATIVDASFGSEECERSCLTNCNCTAFAHTTDMPESGFRCVMWTGFLEDVRRYSSGFYGQELYVKYARRDLERRNTNTWTERNKKRNTNTEERIIGFTVGACILFLVAVVMLCVWKRKPVAALIASREMEETSSADWKSAPMEYEIIADATNNFSDENMIGKGGYGEVYKGMLRDGQEIAVKRLIKQTEEAVGGFFNEVKLIAMLQHTNLVRLLGYYLDDHVKLLVYEFLENSSLDTYLFDKNRSSTLNWTKRLEITIGIARGLLYLHQDSRFRIVHLDIKASNILLGQDMVPKISDFGMATILQGDGTEAVASALAGTAGYMAPELRNDKIYSVKSDVYSFGVLLLEIVTGTKTREFEKLICFVWTLWSEGKGLEIVDPVLKDSASSYRPEQALRLIHIGLLCVQEHAEDRPTMSSVVLMLGSDIQIVDLPKSPVETGSSSSTQDQLGASSTTSRNLITISAIDCR